MREALGAEREEYRNLPLASALRSPRRRSVSECPVLNHCVNNSVLLRKTTEFETIRFLLFCRPTSTNRDEEGEPCKVLDSSCRRRGRWRWRWRRSKEQRRFHRFGHSSEAELWINDSYRDEAGRRGPEHSPVRYEQSPLQPQRVLCWRRRRRCLRDRRRRWKCRQRGRTQERARDPEQCRGCER